MNLNFMRYLLLLLGWGCLIFASCSQTEQVAEATATAESPTPIPTSPPTTAPPATATTPPPTATNTPTIVPLSTAVYQANGTITLDGKIIFDIEAESIPCYPDIPAEIVYSPTLEHFLLIPACIEGDNFLYLFRADGTGKQLITAPWDFLNFNNVTWAEDGQSFSYQRVNSCCLTPPDDAPPMGLVQYDLATGTKTLIATPTPRP